MRVLFLFQVVVIGVVAENLDYSLPGFRSLLAFNTTKEVTFAFKLEEKRPTRTLVKFHTASCISMAAWLHLPYLSEQQSLVFALFNVESLVTFFSEIFLIRPSARKGTLILWKQRWMPANTTALFSLVQPNCSTKYPINLAVRIALKNEGSL
jgi:hypothetical protein